MYNNAFKRDDINMRGRGRNLRGRKKEGLNMYLHFN